MDSHQKESSSWEECTGSTGSWCSHLETVNWRHIPYGQKTKAGGVMCNPNRYKLHITATLAQSTPCKCTGTYEWLLTACWLRNSCFQLRTKNFYMMPVSLSLTSPQTKPPFPRRLCPSVTKLPSLKAHQLFQDLTFEFPEHKCCFCTYPEVTGIWDTCVTSCPGFPRKQKLGVLPSKVSKNKTET